MICPRDFFWLLPGLFEPDVGLVAGSFLNVYRAESEPECHPFCRDKILNRVEECSALFCYNDQIAFQLIRMLQEKGIRVPEDVSVISIDDSDLTLHSEVPITSLPHPKEKLGARAAEVLLDMIDGKKGEHTVEFDTRVVERQSVKDLKI